MSLPLRCRFCMFSKNLSINLNVDNTYSKQIHEKILFVIPEILENDHNLPQNICTTCNTELSIAYKFKKKCLASHKKLIILLEDRKITETDPLSIDNVTNSESILYSNSNNLIIKEEIIVKSESDFVNFSVANIAHNSENLTANNLKKIKNNENKDSETYDKQKVDEILEKLNTQTEEIINSIENLTEQSNNKKYKLTNHKQLYSLLSNELKSDKNIIAPPPFKPNTNNLNSTEETLTLNNLKEIKNNENNDSANKRIVNEHVITYDKQKVDEILKKLTAQTEEIIKSKLSIENLTEQSSNKKYKQLDSVFNNQLKKSYKNIIVLPPFKSSTNNPNSTEGRFVHPENPKIQFDYFKNDYNQIYVCKTCDKQFQSMFCLMEHIHIHANYKRYKCNECDYASYSKNVMRYHKSRRCKDINKDLKFIEIEKPKLVHENTVKNICEVCGSQFIDIEKHKLVHENTVKNICEFCGASLKTKLSLKNHISDLHQTKSNNERPKCKLCHKLYKSKRSLNMHIRSHNQSNFHYKCTICDKKFMGKSNLVIHMRSHSNEFPYKCKYCDKRFKQTGYYQLHLRIHNNERRHKCSVCYKCFFVPNDLKKHMFSHTGIKPFKCFNCDEKFISVKSRTRHHKICTKKTT